MSRVKGDNKLFSVTFQKNRLWLPEVSWIFRGFGFIQREIPLAGLSLVRNPGWVSWGAGEFEAVGIIFLAQIFLKSSNCMKSSELDNFPFVKMTSAEGDFFGRKFVLHPFSIKCREPSHGSRTDAIA